MKNIAKCSPAEFVSRAAVITLLALIAACSERADRVPTSDAEAPAASTDTDEREGSPPRAVGPAFVPSSETPESMTAMQTGGVCSLENVVTVSDNVSRPGDMPNSYKVSRDSGYRLVGFAINKDKGAAPTNIEIVLSGLQSYSIRVESGRPREDVAKYFDNPAFANAGFMGDADFSGVEAGDYAVYVLEHDGDEKAACSTNQAIAVL